MSDVERGESEPATAVVLDYLPHGRADDDRPAYQKSPLAFTMSTDEFRIYELVVDDDADLRIGDRAQIDPPGEGIESVRAITFEDLPSGAKSEVEYVVRDVIDAEEERFVDFYNNAQPITLRLHQLNLLPGIGKKLRNSILDERKRTPFESFDDVEQRVAGLHNPKGVLADRILEELREKDLKYRLFVRRESSKAD